MRRAIGLLVAGLFAVLVVVPATPVASAAVERSGLYAATVDQPPPTTAPAGPALNPEQAPSKSRQKLIIGFFAAVLLVIVFFGRRARNKRRRKAGSATVN